MGYAEENPVVLPAPQSYLSGELRFHNQNGYAHDWIDGWSRVEDAVHWEIDVVRPGTYEVSLAYACASPDLGAKIAVSAGGAEWTAAIDTATPMNFVPNDNRLDNTHYIDLAWGNLRLGRGHLPKGRTRLNVKALTKPGRSVMQLKSVSLRRIE